MMPFRIPSNYKSLPVSMFDAEYGGVNIREYIKWLRRELATAREFLRQVEIQDREAQRQESRVARTVKPKGKANDAA